MKHDPARNCQFHLDRTRGEPLHEQLGRALREAVASGEYRPGDALPSIRELASSAGVAAITARRALAGLAADGITTMRRHVGSVVAGGMNPAYFSKRVVLFSQWHYFPWYFDQLLGEIRSRLLGDGAAVMFTVVSRHLGDKSFPQLNESLKGRCDLVVEIGHDPVSRKAIEDSGCKFIAIGDGWTTVASNAPGCVGTVDLRNRLGNLDFVRDCVRKRVRRVTVFTGIKRPYDIDEPLAVAGIRTRTMLLGSHGRPGDLAQASFNAVRKWIADSHGKFPDVVFFPDDHIARGGLCALACAGVAVPGDVAVVSHANKGFGPVWERPLTRREMDPVEHGRAIAEAISGYLRGRPFPEDFVLGSKYIQGETF